MRAVVTGGAGFVGSHLIEALLKEGHEVACVERPGAGRGWLNGLDVDFHDCGLGDAEKLRRIMCPADVVYHLAALTEARTPADCYEVNTMGTARLFEAVAGCPASPPRVVFMSSLAAVGPAPEGGAIGDDTAPMPLSHYGRSKLQAEAVVHAYADRVPGVICRFPAIYGPRDRVVLKLFRMVAWGFALTIGPWEREVSVIHAADAVDGLLAAGCEGRAVGQTYNLAHPSPVTWGMFVAAIAHALQRHPYMVSMPAAAIRPIAYAAEAAAWLARRAAVLNRDRVRELAQPSWVCDPTPAIEDLGFAPAFPLPEGVAHTAAWLRRNQWI